MNKGNDIQAELKELGSSLVHMSRAMPFNLPAGYFDAHTSNVSFYTLSEDINVSNQQIPFAVPKDFFENLPQQILKFAQMEDAAASLPKSMPYAVPQGYFQALPAHVMAQVSSRPAGKTIALAPRMWLRQAVAAVLLIAIGLGGYEYATRRHISPEKQLAKVSENAVRAYVRQNINEADAGLTVQPADIAVADAIKQLDQGDIEQYLDETGVRTGYSIN